MFLTGMNPYRAAAKSICLGAILTALIVGALFPLTASASQPKRLYVSKTPALTAELTVYRRHIFRAYVYAPGKCDNGETTAMGFGIRGGSGLPLRGPRKRFNRTRIGRFDEVFRGRVENEKIVGFFRSSFRKESQEDEGGAESLCGNGTPKGRWVHFVARLVTK